MNLNEYTTVFHLVGEQTLPVYLAAMQFSPRANHFLLTSESQKTELTVHRLQSALRMKGVSSKIIYLGDESIAVSYQALLPRIQQIVQEKQTEESSSAFEITGGTKLMAFAALMVSNHKNMRAFYVDTKGKQFVCLNRENESYDLKCEMSIEEFVALNGVKLKTEKNLRVEREFLRYLYANSRCIQQYQEQFAKSINKKPNEQLFRDTYAEMLSQQKKKLSGWNPYWNAFCKTNKLENNWQAQAKFLSGGWYEHYVYEELRESKEIREILLNATVSFPETNKTAQEFDVVYTDGCSLVIVECKAGRILQDYVQKLNNLRNEYSGALGKCALINLNASETNANVGSSIVDRITGSRSFAGFFGKEGLQILKEHLFDFRTGTVYEKDNENWPSPFKVLLNRNSGSKR